MDASFRVRVRKGDGVTKKGPMIAKHPSPPSTVNVNISTIQNKEAPAVRSPVGNGPFTPIISHRRRPLSPDPRGGNNAKSKDDPKKSTKGSTPIRHQQSHHVERPKSPPNSRRLESRGGIYGSTRTRTRQNVTSPTSPTIKRVTPPSSPQIKPSFFPLVTPRLRQNDDTHKCRTVPLKAFHPNPKSNSPNGTLQLATNNVRPVIAKKYPAPQRPCSPRGISPRGSSPRGTSPRGGSPRGTSPRGTLSRGSSPRGSSPRGRGSSPGSRTPLISEETLKLRVKRVFKERLYLLHQPGPNSFSVGAESPKHKYKVIIGPQTCSCGHGPFCIHVLFIMVRVLQVSERNPLLIAGSLKDFEVEQLLRGWEERRKTAIRSRERRALGLLDTKERLPLLFPLKGGAMSQHGSSGTVNNVDTNTSKYDCPICLMVMEEGESLVACEAGCRNLLHHHCMAVWANDRYSQGQKLECPLCRAPWPYYNKPQSIGGNGHCESQARVSVIQGYHHPPSCSSHPSKIHLSGAPECGGGNDLTQIMSASFSGMTSSAGHSPTSAMPPIMSRSLSSAWPHSPPLTSYRGQYQRATSYGGNGVFPHPPTVRGEISEAFVHSASEELVPLPHSEPIPSEHEQTAQTWVNVFGRELIACLFSRDWVVRETGLRRLAHEVVKVLRWDRLVTTEQSRQKVIQCSANILAQVSNDPVYKVYLACLRCVRVLLAHLCPTEAADIGALQNLLKPLLHTLLLKCADGNKRTSQISIDSIIELCRGQSGELALATHTNGTAATPGLGGITYVLTCILNDSPPTEAPWQWLLGRLCVLDRLLDEFPQEFQLQVVQSNPVECGYKLQHYNRLLTVVEFAFKALGSNHATVAKLARRIYICGARMAAAEPAVFNQVCDMLAKLDVSLQMRLKRRLRSMQGNHGERKGSLARLGDMFPLPPKEALVSGGTRLVRSVSHSPSRMFSALRSSSQSPARHLFSKPKPERENIPEKKKIPSPPRPTHLPLDGFDLKFKEKQAKIRLYHKTKARQELPLIIQHALLSPNRDKFLPKSNKSNLLSKGGKLSQSYSDNLDLSPQTLSLGVPQPPQFLLKDALCSPITPNTPSSTPVMEEALIQIRKETTRCIEPDLPRIPGLDLLPKYLDENADSSDMNHEGKLYEEGCDWFKGPLLGTGAFSSCFQARDVLTGTIMAVKQVSICRNNEEDQERVEAAVEEEVLLMCKLRHQNIVRMLGATRLPTSFSVFTEWMAGGSVAGMLDKYGAFSEPVISKYTNQILLGLCYLHDNMILHRDLKGANLLIDSTGQLLRIGDFGTAARLASKATVTGEFQGQLLGTIAFMAPEVLRGDNYGRACDVWSVGCCIIEMATTKPPWGAMNVSNQYKLMFRIATSNEPPHVPECLSDDMRHFALLCLQINSELRPHAGDLLKHALFNTKPP